MTHYLQIALPTGFAPVAQVQDIPILLIAQAPSAVTRISPSSTKLAPSIASSAKIGNTD